MSSSPPLPPDPVVAAALASVPPEIPPPPVENPGQASAPPQVTPPPPVETQAQASTPPAAKVPGKAAAKAPAPRQPPRRPAAPPPEPKAPKADRVADAPPPEPKAPKADRVAELAERVGALEGGIGAILELLRQRPTVTAAAAAPSVAPAPAELAPPPPAPEGVIVAVQDLSAAPIQATSEQREPVRPILPNGGGASYLTPDLRTGVQVAVPEVANVGPRQAERRDVATDAEGVTHARPSVETPFAGADMRTNRLDGVPAPPPGVLNWAALQGVGATQVTAQATQIPAAPERPSGVIVAVSEGAPPAPPAPVTPAPGPQAVAVGVVEARPAARQADPTQARSPTGQLIDQAGTAFTQLVNIAIELPDSPLRTAFLEGLSSFRSALPKLAALAEQL